MKPRLIPPRVKIIRSTLRLPEMVHNRLKELAKENGLSLHQYISLVLFNHIAPDTFFLKENEEEPEFSIDQVEEVVQRYRAGASDEELDALVARLRAENEAQARQKEQQRELVAAD